MVIVLIKDSDLNVFFKKLVKVEFTDSFDFKKKFMNGIFYEVSEEFIFVHNGRYGVPIRKCDINDINLLHNK